MTREDLRDLGEEPPPTEDELREAAALREALDTDAPHVGADYLRDLRAMHAPEDLDELRHQRMLNRALGKPQHATRLQVAVTLSIVAAAAATVLFVLREPERAAPQVARRSTEELFSGRGGPGATTTERIDRIAQARSRDLRENRFARWGVK